MRDLAQFLDYMNHTDFKYVVMRNWENLPYKVETGIHSDLDLLVYDFDHFHELFPQLERVYPKPRVQYKLYLDSGEFIQMDIRSVGDGYYPEQFQVNMLNTREWNKNGFWTPNPIHHRLGLAYHAVHHKNGNNYANYLGPVSVGKLLEALKQNEELAWVEPDDPSVGRFNAYSRGATSVVSEGDGWIEKRQVRYTGYKLTDNEERILNLLSGSHFPALVFREGDNLRIEHCGEPLGSNNLPENWKEQLVDIIRDLEKCGVVHRDIRLDNLMIKDGVIKLLDFGWARLSNESDGRHPDLLGYPNKCPLGFNDIYSMNMVIKQLEAELEEATECQNKN